MKGFIEVNTEAGTVFLINVRAINLMIRTSVGNHCEISVINIPEEIRTIETYEQVKELIKAAQ